MSTELGRIERPSAEPYKGEKKIYLVPLVYTPKDPPADYLGRLERYWAGVREHVRRLEERIGAVTHVFHESVPEAGESGLKMIEQINHRSAEIARQKCDEGAELVALEDVELLAENVDWQRCLMIGLASRVASEHVWNAYREASRRRNEYIAEHIEKTLGPSQAGLLFIREDHGIQFPSDVRVFYVSPPALDEIHRWLRDRPASEATTTDEEGAKSEPESEDGQQP